MIAALYVVIGGVYFGLPNVDPWDATRDARKYAGPYPVVAHPPCERWGRYYSGGPSARVRRELGDDGGCFAAALDAVRKWGGVLEHPEASSAFHAFGIAIPPKTGGWVGSLCGGFTCCVEQGHYGHRARKATWLYAFNTERPELAWGKSPATARLDGGWHSTQERRDRPRAIERTRSNENAATPIAFRDVLLCIAETAGAVA